MRTVTLREFFDLQGYGKGKEINVSTFAELCGVSISYVSKLYNNRFAGSSTNTETFKKIANYVKDYGYTLVRGDIMSLADNGIRRENNKLKLENASLKSRVAQLEQELADLNEIKRLAHKICERS